MSLLPSFGETLYEAETIELEKLLAELKLRKQQNDSSRADKFDGDLSDLSEDDDNLYLDKENEKDMKLIQLKLKPTSNLNIKNLFTNADKVKILVHKTCLASNIEVNPDRSDLAAVQEEEPETVSSTHSEADDDIVYPETPIVIRPMKPVLPPAPRIEERYTRLDVDNLLVLKSNVCSSKRHPEYGSPMIRALVSSIYKHACHRDLYTIFMQVQTKLVKKLYADEDSERSRNLVVIWKTLPHRKRLYLFPGFDGLDKEEKP
ncbi:hypothetical protein EB796_016500 [Bugula neritina]|uniref:Caspase family p10 domain-containing protein n=1 Tax=Bugula neritina TaxID=10212 RepID=A0A7J7JFW5_BUGNE|nr:hypothetical protein EB796_016500 [Bugula neritina]